VTTPPGRDGPYGAVKNEDIARVFGEIADYLELGEDNAYRVIAYRNAERELRSTGYDIAALLAAGEPLPKMPGIGPELSAKIREIFQTGTSRTLERLRKDYPPGILDLLRLPGVGPRRVRRFYKELGIGSLEELERAIRAGKLRALGGFGGKSEQRLLEAIMTVKSPHARRL
jgi:DNA polymerase (family 10)